jgi:hypothetical protein
MIEAAVTADWCIVDALILSLTGVFQLVLAGLGFWATISPPKRAEGRKRKVLVWIFVGAGIVSLLLVVWAGLRSSAAQEQFKTAFYAALHSGGAVLPSEIRIVNQDRYDAAEVDRVLIVRKAIGAPTNILMPSNPRPGISIEVKDGNGDADRYPITIHGNGAKIDSLDRYVLNSGRQEIGLIFDGEQWDIR